jgi:hypothetical protein
MKRLIWGAAILFLASATCAYADSVPTFNITQVSMPFGPNNGSGDNMFFSFAGPGTSITGSGTIGCEQWCFFGTPLSPGSSLNPSVVVFFDSVNSIVLGGQMPSTETFLIKFVDYGPRELYLPHEWRKYLYGQGASYTQWANPGTRRFPQFLQFPT